MDRKKWIEPILYIALIIALLAPRLPGLDSYVTLDEPYWLSMGANFYYAVSHREFQNTVYEYQPAVTTLWIVTAAMLVYFPEYRGFGQGYPSYNKGWLDLFLIEHGKHPLELLQTARVIQVFVIAILFLILYYLLRRFVDKYIAAFAILFASFDPFFLSQSRMLDHEALLSLFVLISVLALLAYLAQERKLIFLLISGAAAGLAQLTKSSALAILAPVGILFLIRIYQERGQGWGKTLLNHAKIFLIWFGVLAAAYVIFWPGMWVAPQKMLYEVYGNAFSYAFQGGRLAVTGELESSEFSLDFNFAGMRSLVEMFLRRTTPLTWLGILLGFALLKQKESVYKILFTLLWITAAAFVIMFGIAQGRNSPHYILCSYLALNLLAGLGWFTVVQWFSESYNNNFRFSRGNRRTKVLPQYMEAPSGLVGFSRLLRTEAGIYPAGHKDSPKFKIERLFSHKCKRFAAAFQIQSVVLPLLLCFQLLSAIPFYPYYYTYENPLLQRRNADIPLFPYGEGLELAGQYLASLPDAKDSTALVYYSRGCFSYFYPGVTTGFKNYYTDGHHPIELLDALRSADYLVVYYVVQGHTEKYAGYVEALSAVKPLHEVWLDGRKYVIIYRVDQIPESVLDQLRNLKPLE